MSLGSTYVRLTFNVIGLFSWKLKLHEYNWRKFYTGNATAIGYFDTIDSFSHLGKLICFSLPRINKIVNFVSPRSNISALFELLLLLLFIIKINKCHVKVRAKTLTDMMA